MAISYGHLNAQTAGPNAYKIAFEPANTRLMKIEADLTAASDIFEMSEYAPTPVSRPLGQFVRGLRAYGANGTPLDVKDLGDAKMADAVKPGEKVRLNYNVLLDQTNTSGRPGSTAFLSFGIGAFTQADARISLRTGRDRGRPR
ncbi:MAG: hypothetical protein IPM25_20275 [Chloracidobacterium sp.]|nr:hypothetical protein [Chloracidobacterium sp.]